MKLKKIWIIPTKKFIEYQYQRLVKETGRLLPTTRLSIFLTTLSALNGKEYLKDFLMDRLEILKNAKMIKIKIYEVDAWLRQGFTQ